MNNEEKARTLCCSGCENYTCYTSKRQCRILKDLIDMAEWKDVQYEEEKKELRGLVDMLPMNENNQTIIEDLKAILL